MPKPAITTFSSVAVKPSSTNKDNGLYAPQLTTAQIAAIPANTLVNGALVYDTDANRLKSFVNGGLVDVGTGTGSGSINTSLATTVECQNRIQIFESPVPDDFFVVGIQNQALLTTILQIGAAGAPAIWLGYNPIGTGLAYLECHGVPFTISTNGNHTFYVTPSGNVGIGTTTPNAPLQFASTLANRKIVLYELVNNDHQFFGLGVNTNTARYQVPNITSNHIFYAATSATTSNELARITGDGDIVAASNIYGRRPSGIIYALNGAPSTTPVVGTWVKIASSTTPMVATNLFSTPINNRLVYTGSRTIMAQINLSVTISPSTSLSTNYGISIYKNGVRVFGSDSYVTTTTTTYYSVSTIGFTTMSTNDYIEAFILSDRINSVTTSTLILSVTTT